MKRASISGDQIIFSAGVSDTARTLIYFDGTSSTFFFINNTGSGYFGRYLNAAFRDTSSWYHIIVSVDTNQATSSNRIKFYINGALQASTAAGGGDMPDVSTFVNNTNAHAIGRNPYDSTGHVNGYLTEINFIDGQALTPSSFGETDATTGRWKAKAYTGTYGTNGFYLPFTNQGTTQNLFTYSEDFSNAAAWTTYQSTATANAAVAPNGTTTADKLVETATVGDHQFSRASTAIDNTTYTLSAYAKAAERSQFRLYLQNKAGTYNNSDFNLTTGTISGASGVVPAISDVGNGWYRCSVTANAGTGAFAAPLAILSYGTGTAGSGTNGLFVWGAQIEASSSAGPYMYTGASAQASTLAIGADASVSTGGYNNWVANNFSVTPGAGNDSLTDSPSNYGAISTTLVNDTYQISKSLRFNSADSANLTRTFGTSGNLTTWTWSGWIKPTKMSAQEGLFYSGDGSTFGNSINFNPSNQLEMYYYNGGYVWRYLTTQAFRDPTAWYHVVGVYDSSNSTQADRVRLYVNGVRITSFSISTAVSTISQVGVVNNSSFTHYVGSEGAGNFFNGYLADVNFIDGQALTPTSFGTRDINTYLWKPKAYTGTYGTNGFYLNFSDNSGITSTTLGKDQAGSNNWTPSGTPGFSVSAGPGNDSLVDSPTYYGTDTGVGGEARGNYCTFDSSLPLDSTSQATNLLNGNLQVKGYSASFNTWGVGTIAVSSGKWYFELTNDNGADWQRLGVISTSGRLNPFDASASYFYYSLNGNKLSTGATAGYGATWTTGDVIGCALDLDNGKIWFSKNGFWQGSGDPITGVGAAFTGLSGSFAPAVYIGSAVANSAYVNFGQRQYAYPPPFGFQPLRDYNKLPTPTGGEVRGNYCTLNPLDFSCPGTISNGNLQYVQSTLNPRGGRSTIAVSSGKWYWEVTNNGGNNCPGIIRDTGALTSSYIGSNADGWGYFIDGQKYNNGTGTNYGASYTTNDVIGVALDMDARTLAFYKNGVSQGTAFSGLSGTMSPAFSSSNGFAVSFTVNFGQRPWAYDAPFGFLPLCTTLLPQPIVQKPSSYMDVVTYTGTGATQSITSLGFSPDLVWVKSRNNNTWHILADTVRGANKHLSSNNTELENTDAAGIGFASNGFTLGADTVDAYYGWNINTNTYVAWAWDESPIAGMDIVSYSGTGAARTVPHNLGVPPKMIIIKGRTNAYNWNVYHAGLLSPTNNKLYLDDTAKENNGGTNAGTWNSTAPTSSAFSLGTFLNVNENLKDFIAYLFAEVEGFSKFGSYTGNGSADGPFVYCGFRPRYIMYKRTDAVGNWNIIDTARDTYNPEQTLLRANLGLGDESNAVYTQDFLANGWKIRSTNVDINVSTATYIFAAFAESPFKYSRAR